MKKCLIAALILLLPAGVLAQEESNIITSGSIKAGVQQDNINENSSKFNEYRDIKDGFNLYELDFEAFNNKSGLFLELGGENVMRDDQFIRFGVGSYGTWNLGVEHNKTPHNLSNKAMTPYFNQGNGLFTLSAPVAIPNPILRPSNAQAAAGVLRDNDDATAVWLGNNLHGIDLGTQRDETSATLQVTPSENLKLRLTYSDDRKDGSKLTYGPIGDRPPRTTNIQFTEPIDYQTREVKFEAEYNRDRFQTLFSYLVSDFENDIDTLTWQSIYVNPLAGNDYETWGWTGNARDYNVAEYGSRALAPDNSYQNASLTFGVDLPLASRLAGTVAYGKMEQDETLIPYATTDFGSAVDFSSTALLPRLKADTEIETKLFNLDYTIKPIERLHLRAFYRFYDLDNNTDEDDWHYVTQDTLPTNTTDSNGVTTPTYKNMRTNLAYGYDQQNFGLDATYSMNLWRTTLALGYEREEIDRDYREADTDENKYKVSVRTRPADWVTLRAKYLYGDREADNYDGSATSAGYWYALGDQGTDLDNPKFTFTNHPDTRKYDVSDRERHQVDLGVTLMPVESLSLTATYRWQDDDYDSDVKSTQPLLDYPGTLPLNTVGDTTVDSDNRNAATPGDQIGLLEREINRYSLDAAYVASERLTLNAFASRETIESKQRGLEYNENNKMNPVTSNLETTNELGPWTRASSQWMAKTDDRTNTFGAGAGFQIIPGKLNLLADYVFSHGKVDIDYSGFGAVSALNPSQTLADIDQYAFRDPKSITHKQYTFNVTLEYQVVKNLVFGLHYLYDKYKISDWAQEANNPWTESVGSEYLLRDTSSATSTQWGNRLVNMGSYLGPDYEAHVSFLTLTYKF